MLCCALLLSSRVPNVPVSALTFHAWRLWKVVPLLIGMLAELPHEPSASFPPVQVVPVLFELAPLICARAADGTRATKAIRNRVRTRDSRPRRSERFMGFPPSAGARSS